MIDLPKRAFLIGSAAAITAAMLPLALDATVLDKIGNEGAWERRYSGIGLDPGGASARRLRAFLMSDDKPVLDFTVGPHENFIWRAIPECELLVTPSRCLRFEIEGPQSALRVTYTERRNGMERQVVERYEPPDFRVTNRSMFDLPRSIRAHQT